MVRKGNSYKMSDEVPFTTDSSSVVMKPLSSTDNPNDLSYVNYSFNAEEIDQVKPYENGNTFPMSEKVNSKVTTEVRWKNLEVFVNGLKGPKQILKSVNGYASNLEMMAIMGPSGAGKSTLLNTIAGT